MAFLAERRQPATPNEIGFAEVIQAWCDEADRDLAEGRTRPMDEILREMESEADEST